MLPKIAALVHPDLLVTEMAPKQSLLAADPEKEEMMRELDMQYGGCVYVTRKLRKHEKEAKERAEAEAAAAREASKPGWRHWSAPSANQDDFSTAHALVI